MFEKGYVSKAQKVSEELNFQKAKFALEQAQSKLNVLEKYTKDKTIKELKSEVEKARSDELAKKQTCELEKDKEAKLEKQIVNCKLFAPGDGLVVYANDPIAFVRQQRSRRSRKGRRSASGRRSSACPTSPRCRSTPRSTSRDRQDHARACRPGSGSTPSPTRSSTGTVARRRPAARPDQLLQLGHQGLHDPRHDRQRRCRASGPG